MSNIILVMDIIPFIKFVFGQYESIPQIDQ